MQWDIVDACRAIVVEDLTGDVKGAEVGTQERPEYRLPTLRCGKRDGENDEKNRQHQNSDFADVTLIQTLLDETSHAISPFAVLYPGRQLHDADDERKVYRQFAQFGAFFFVRPLKIY